MYTYTDAKRLLYLESVEAKKQHGNDLPAIREQINDTADYILREMSLRRTDARMRQYERWLSSYACKLHPKKAKK